MKPSFYIVDDDIGVRRILNNLIDEYRLGYVIGESGDGSTALNEILDCNPDIALIDLLLPSIDGVEIVKRIKKEGLKTQLIMLSQVTSKDIVGEAYKQGIEYYINKPINVIEVVSIIKKATENINIQQALMVLSRTMKKDKLNFFNNNEETEEDNELKDIRESVLNIFADLGILGNSGSEDLFNIIIIILEERKELGVPIHNYRISDIYNKLISRYKNENDETISIKAIEQRIRRIIQIAIENLASLGIEDYSNIKFEKYSTSLFDFKEVKAEMDYMRNKGKYRGKINVKKFIEGIISHISI